MKQKDSGFYLIELMIIVILISVVATAYWNFRSGRLDPLPQDFEASTGNSFVQAALDEIGYHVCFARQNAAEGSMKPVIIEDGVRSDRIIIFHNFSRYEYFVDDNGNLTRRLGMQDEILVPGVQSLKIARIGSQTVIVTITTSFQDGDVLEDNGIISRSFSSVVAANGLDRSE